MIPTPDPSVIRGVTPLTHAFVVTDSDVVFQRVVAEPPDAATPVRLGISRNVLTTRLDTLVDGGVLERRPYDDAGRRFDYVLTDKGRSLWPVMTAIRQWDDEWILGEGNEPALLEHRDHGHLTAAQMTCDVCGEALDARAVRAVPSPGGGRIALR